jgi:predicted metal-dependent phosphoesterase TrpH
MNRVDLHTHTTASDGTMTPAELVAEARRVRLDVLAICDHDSTEGIAPALSANPNGALHIIPGIEVNTDVPDGEVHVLGYFRQVPQGAIQDLLVRLREGRYVRAQRMAEKMAALGMPISFERVVEIAGGGSIGRPHPCYVSRPCAAAASPMMRARSCGRDHIGQWPVGRSIQVMSCRSA